MTSSRACKICVTKMLLMLITFLTPSFAAEHGRLVYTAIAEVSCGEWLKLRENQSSKPFDLAPALELQGANSWLLGYISAENQWVFEREKNADLLEDVDGATIFDWTDTFCRKDPKSDISESASALLLMLYKQRLSAEKKH
jgi:hypothetical protein